jgi:molecular chaperone DnaK
VETHGGTVAPLIRANTTIPTTCSEVFTTGADDQDSVEIHITQGERPIASENRSLARFHLDGIPPAPRGAPQIEVSFALDANGILSVAARDSSTGRAQRVTVAPSSGLCEDDVDRMVREAALYVEQDRARQEAIALRNEADALLYSALRVARDAGGGVPAEQREKLDAVVSALKLSLPTGDTAQIRERMGRVRHVADTIRAIGDAAAPGEGEDVPPRRALG